MHWPGQPGDAVLHLPRDPAVSGVVCLHGAADGRARQPLFEHLAGVLHEVGVAVLTYPRRASNSCDDTPLEVQAQDAVQAMAALRARLNVPVGVFGFSQGAWAAAMAATDPVASFLITLGCSGVSPATQMRYYTDELLRRRGFSDDDRRRLRLLRLDVEAFVRMPDPDQVARRVVNRALRSASGLPWFVHAYLPDELPPGPMTWSDMDFDPVPVFGRVQVPVLALWGDDKECVPRLESQQAWTVADDVIIRDLPGCGHWPVVGSGSPDFEASVAGGISSAFDSAVLDWLGREFTKLPG